MALGYPYYVYNSLIFVKIINKFLISETYIVRALFFVAFLAFAAVVDGQAPGVCNSDARLVLM